MITVLFVIKGGCNSLRRRSHNLVEWIDFLNERHHIYQEWMASLQVCQITALNYLQFTFFIACAENCARATVLYTCICVAA